MTSVSGVRGVFADTLDPAVVLRYAARFGELLKRSHPRPLVVVGRDSRTTGIAVQHAVISALIGVGCDVLEIGIVATPTVLLCVKNRLAAGGIAITASHNPPQWNAMKFVDGDAMFLAPKRAALFLNSVDENITWSTWENVGTHSVYADAIADHIRAVLAIPYLDLELIRKAHFKVVLDSVNGAGGLISPLLLEALGCEVIEINAAPTGIFAHPAEPLNHNLHQLEAAVKEHKADIGFATDPDVDRLSIVDETGHCIGEELSVVLAQLFVLPKKQGDVVVNLSTSMLSDDIARRFGVKLHRSKVGEINVGKLMQELSSPIGGEGNGGIICPEVNYTRDAIAGMALILGLLAESGKSVSGIVSELPKYHFAKDKITVDPVHMDEIMARIPDLFAGYDVDTRDGIKLSRPDHWIHIRKSGTEPIIRIYVESDSLAKSQQLCAAAIGKLQA
ncbi:MAG: phosphoglucosamine mutase [Candidatus Cloacimonadaceae bacterium]|nr:phosphoglucosamine mutase [Candidatus Cloacimonadaceae bacterium]